MNIHSIKVGLIGSPVYHSKSPNIYMQLFSAYNISGSFSVIDLPQGGLSDIRNIFESKQLDALAVTMPHKKSILQYLDVIDEQAQKLESVNFIKAIDGKLYGYSTDGDGFLLSLTEHGVNPEKKNVLIYGYGGAASAVAFCLKKAGACVKITGRDELKAQILASKLGVDWCSSIDLSDWDIFINATPLGMSKHPNFHDFSFLEKGKDDLYICDLIYEPSQTLLIQNANDMGFKTITGHGMLYNQAKIAFNILLENAFL